MEQSHLTLPISYTIGSRSRSLLRFSYLLVAGSGTLGILYSVILHLISHVLGDGPENSFFACSVLAGGMFAAFIEGLVFRRIPRLFAFLTKDSAAGFADTSGLRYRSFLKWHNAPWKDVSRIEYFMADKSRIHIFRFGSHVPIRFGPTRQTGRTPSLVEFLKNQMLSSNGVFIEHTTSANSQLNRPKAFGLNGGPNRKLIAKTLLVLSAFVWLGCFGLSQYYSYTRPRFPDISAGRIYEHKNRGWVTYVSAQEKNVLNWLEFSAPSLLVVGLLVQPRRRIWQRPTSDLSVPSC